MKTQINFIIRHKLETILVVVIVCLALFLRLYRIGEFMTFLGDEGRDVRIVRDLITKGNLVFIGPQTSIGNMYLGPLYYYMMAPFLLLSGLNPVGPAIMVALLGVLTVYLTYYIGKRWFGMWPGLIAGLLYAISPVAIIYSRSSWNPNPMPLFSLLCVYGIYEVWKNKNFKWLTFVGLFFAAALQMHYLGLLLAPVLGLFWLLSLKEQKNKSLPGNEFFKKTASAIVIFLVFMSPLVFFDLKHQGMNFNAFRAFFSDRQTTVNLNPARSDRFIPVISGTVTDLVLARQNIYPLLFALVLAVTFYFSFKKAKDQSPYIALAVWIVFGLLGLGLYKQHVYIHYLGFIYPAVYLLLGVSIGSIVTKKFPRCFPGALILVFLIFLSLSKSPVLETPNNQLKRTEEAVDIIIEKSNGDPFNFALIAKQNYDESYRYFLENKKANLVSGDVKVTDQLFVVCEDGDLCAPEGHSRYQIAIFGPAKIDQQWTHDYLKIYRLVHSQK